MKLDYENLLTNVEKEMPRLLEFLRGLEFEPTNLELKELYSHLENSIKCYHGDLERNVKRRGDPLSYDKFSVFYPAYEAFIRFLCYEYGIIKDEKDFSKQYFENRLGLIARLKREQAKRFHFEYDGRAA